MAPKAPEIFFFLLGQSGSNQAKNNLADKLLQISANPRCNGKIFTFFFANPRVGHGNK